MVTLCFILQSYLITEYHDLELEIRPELPKNRKSIGRSMASVDTKAEKAVLKIAKKNSDVFKTNGTLGTKILLHVADQQTTDSKGRSLSRKDVAKKANEKEKRLRENQLRNLISG